MNSMLSEQQINLILSTGTIKTYKNEEFITHKYNDIEIIYRRKDMYFNAGAMCRSQGKRINKLFETKYWNDEVKPLYTKYLNTRYPNLDTAKALPILSYTLDGSYQEFQGTYMHPKLINRIAQWCSVEYSFKVDRYMDQINEELMLRNITFEQKLQEKDQEIQKLRNHYEQQLKEKDDMLDKHNQGRKMIEGEIEIMPTSQTNVYRIFSRFIKTTNQNPENTYIHTYNPRSIFGNFKFYIKNDLIDGIKRIKNKDNDLYKGDLKHIVSVINDIMQNKKPITKTLKELNEKDATVAESYSNENAKNGLKFEVYISNKYNLNRFKYSNVP